MRTTRREGFTLFILISASTISLQQTLHTRISLINVTARPTVLCSRDERRICELAQREATQVFNYTGKFMSYFSFVAN